jgi:NADH-quinone oxidoreductase subunit N
MNTSTIWILFPGLSAGILYLLRGWRRVVNAAGILAALGLTWLAWRLPIDQPIPLGFWPGSPSIELSDTMVVLGRRFILDESARPFLLFIFMSIAFWFIGAYFANIDPLFVPLGLGMSALLTAALAVEPFLFAALLIEMAALICVPILSPPGKPVGRGVLRFLTFQTLGMPFILLTGWLLTGASSFPNDPSLVVRVAFVTILGFSLLIGIFPFHTWIPMSGEESHPYAAAFVFFVLPGIVSIFGLEFLNRYTWLQTEPAVYSFLRLLGVLMIFTGGVWAAFQRHLGRMLAYAAIIEIGLSLLALSLGKPGAETAPLLGIFFALLLPRGISLGLWALALAAIQAQTGDLSFQNIQGMAHRFPAASLSIILAHFSLASFPLLASFPAHLALWSALASQSLPIAVFAILGNLGLLVGGIRTLTILVTGTENEGWRVSEARFQLGLFGFGWLALFFLGLFPQWFTPFLENMARLLVITGH